jgi:hypothetical protein
MERSEIWGRPAPQDKNPGSAALHPGYGFATAFHVIPAQAGIQWCLGHRTKQDRNEDVISRTNADALMGSRLRGNDEEQVARMEQSEIWEWPAPQDKNPDCAPLHPGYACYNGDMNAEDYQYAIGQCDVPPERHSALEAYRAKRRQWLEWLDTDEHHAIWTSVLALVWNDVSFRTLAQLAVDNPESCLGNTLVAEKLIDGHVATQILAIRRLVDNGRNVISLRSLIKDVRRNVKLFTRENYVCFDGLPYDYEAVRRTNRAGKVPFWGATKGPDAWATSSMVHEHFDRLSGVNAANRSREDRLPVALVDAVEGWLDNSHADELAGWSHAFLAHAGSAKSREKIKQAIVNNNKITEAIRVIARVTEGISAEILYASGRLNSLMPTAQFDQLENLDKPVMRADQETRAYEMWDGLSAERDRFCEGVGEELISAINR